VAAASFPLQPVDGRSSLTLFRGRGVIAPLGKSGKQFLLLSDYLNQSDERGNFCIDRRGRIGFNNIMQADISNVLMISSLFVLFCPSGKFMHLLVLLRSSYSSYFPYSCPIYAPVYLFCCPLSFHRPSALFIPLLCPFAYLYPCSVISVLWRRHKQHNRTERRLVEYCTVYLNQC
jgi:hypothetical protein